MRSFYKASGAGNDFIGLVEPRVEPTPAEIAAWCRRRESVGADGVFVIRRLERELIAMTYFNRDGTRAALCLNGARCAARLAIDLGLTASALTLRTDAGDIRAQGTGAASIRLELGPPGSQPTARALEARGRTWHGHSTTVGVPHLVVPVAQLGDLNVEQVGADLRQHPALAPAGANVMFVRYIERHRLALRSYERGVEAETAACGTGTMAAVQVGVGTDRLALPVVATTRTGHELLVEGRATGGRIVAWSLTGDSRVVARGEILPGADGGVVAKAAG